MGQATVITLDSIYKFALNHKLTLISLGKKMLDKTSSDRRRIFIVNDGENASAEERHACYDKMIDKLNTVEDNELGCLLRVLWKRYEDDLRVHRYDLAEDEYAYSEPHGQDANGNWIDWRISINLARDSTDSTWFREHQVIFHEFFHNIYAIANLKNMGIIENFGNVIANDVNELFKEENNKTGKRLNNITFKVDKRHKAALYDIIGAVFYKGKYGCNPDNYKLYNKNCKKKFQCNASLSRTIPDLAYCQFRQQSEPSGNHNMLSCNKASNCNYRIECRLCINDWCDEIFGHTYDYWLEGDMKNYCLKKNEYGNNPYERGLNKKDPYKKGWCFECKNKNKFPKCVEPKEFYKTLAEEAFVHMAADAITNPKAYKEIMACLPKSDIMFRDILRKLEQRILLQDRKERVAGYLF
ncbi:MAG: hypothetical protein FWC26_06055 [Fibromonadales bacterium]|nr:hypothetical protein [Fibromonadales bacterium]